MLKQIKRWFIGTLALTLIALAALVTPILSSHAAAPHSTSTKQRHPLTTVTVYSQNWY